MSILQHRLVRVVAAAVAVIGWGGVIAAPTAANASLVYDLNRTIGAGTVTGFIETDGTLGVLASGDIVDWILTLTAPNLLGGSPDVITFATQNVTTIVGTATTATSTQLLFDFSSVGPQAFLLQGGGPDFNFYCIENASCTGTVGESMGFGTSMTIAQNVGGQTGVVAFATVAVVPLPAALPLFLSALAGLGLMARRQRKRAA